MTDELLKIKSIEELVLQLNTQRQVGNKLVGQLEHLDIDFDINLPLAKQTVKNRLPAASSNDFVFLNCRFTKTVTFKSSHINFYFLNCTFHDINANDKEFIGKVRFRECEFKSEVLLDNASFRELVDFWHSKFYKKTIFHKVDFDKTVVFSGSTFYENVLFTYTLFAKLGIFRGTVCKKGYDISLAILEGNLSMFDFELKDFDVVMGPLEEMEYESLVHDKGDIPIKNKRETFRILKNIFEKNSDHIISLYYRRLELSTYDVLLKDKINQKIKPWTNRLNRAILWLNYNSNIHGTSFFRGLIFTGCIGWLFFYFSLIATSDYYMTFNPCNWSLKALTDSLKYYFISISPVHKHTYMDELGPTWSFYLADFMGRIFVSYGIYQTVQAFRKFR
ncbi:pentapeptide repeat-containing protein [Constantimarinum furrinae]|uniref:Pentapeptide repeat-containing protein n=1 Tax=Constantimarinum furrinae TaxID=2562285 RepID=A0A7G8PRR2_9FLAO|nr:pentapeptide repeat-containing protein [Constantimarinum furrinae]QNJ97028.1 hypothetical protein ALE3EI_0445 [Constantimarinum furrinae]